MIGSHGSIPALAGERSFSTIPAFRSKLPRLGGRTEGRRRARRRAAFIAREKGGGKSLRLPASGPTLKTLAVEFIERHSPRWKPSTIRVAAVIAVYFSPNPSCVRRPFS